MLIRKKSCLNCKRISSQKMNSRELQLKKKSTPYNNVSLKLIVVGMPYFLSPHADKKTTESLFKLLESIHIYDELLMDNLESFLLDEDNFYKYSIEGDAPHEIIDMSCFNDWDQDYYPIDRGFVETLLLSLASMGVRLCQYPLPYLHRKVGLLREAEQTGLRASENVLKEAIWKKHLVYEDEVLKDKDPYSPFRTINKDATIKYKIDELISFVKDAKRIVLCGYELTYQVIETARDLELVNKNKCEIVIPLDCVINLQVNESRIAHFIDLAYGQGSNIIFVLKIEKEVNPLVREIVENLLLFDNGNKRIKNCRE